MAWYHATQLERQMLIDAGQCVRCFRRRDWIPEAGKYRATAQYCPSCNKILLEAAQNKREYQQMMLAAGKCMRCGELRGKRGTDKHCHGCVIQITYKRKSKHKRSNG